METRTLLLSRRSVRAYEDRPISEEDRNLIFQAVLRAPTAGNMALYSVIDVQNPALRKKLADLCDHQDMIIKAPLCLVFVADYQKWVDYFLEEKCPEKSGKPWKDPGWGDLHLGFQDAIIACQSGVVMAESLGIGSCYIGDVMENGEAIQMALDLPRFTTPACMVIMGYHQSAISRLSPRCPIDDMFMKDTYQRRNKSQLEEAFKAHEEQAKATNRLPYGNTGNLADYYYGRKYTSPFMEEMNRSVAWWFNRWLGGEHDDQGV